MESVAVLKIPVAVVALCCSATLARSDALHDCQQGKDRDRQIAACTQIIRTDQKNAVAFFNRGVAHWAKSEDDFSIGDDSRALLVNPRGIVYSWGLLYAGKGTNAEAIADFT